MEKRAERYIFLHNVRFETEARPIQSNIEISIPIEVVWTKEDVEISNSMDNDEQEEEHGRTGQTNTIVCEDDVILPKYCEDNLLHKAKDHVHQSSETSRDLAMILHAYSPVGLLLFPLF